MHIIIFGKKQKASCYIVPLQQSVDPWDQMLIAFAIIAVLQDLHLEFSQPRKQVAFSAYLSSISWPSHSEPVLM